MKISLVAFFNYWILQISLKEGGIFERISSKIDPIINHLKNLGIDPMNTPKHSTLGEIGLGSMMGVEFQRVLAQEYNLKLNPNIIKMISIEMLMELSSDMNDRDDPMNKFIKNLEQLQLEINYCDHELLNTNNNGETLFFLEPIDGNYSKYKLILDRINQPVVGLNWPSNLTNISMDELGNYFINSAKKFEINFKYNIISTSDMIPIVSEFFQKDALNKTIILFNENDLNCIISNDFQYNFNIKNDDVFKILAHFLIKDAPKIIKKLIDRELSFNNDIEAKIAKFSEILKNLLDKTTKDLNIEKNIFTLYKRLVCLLYIKTDQFQSDKIPSSKISFIDLSGCECDRSKNLWDNPYINTEV